ncbi:MAG: branched-chain amino acid ABC transporter permease [Dehalococcoidia bacterium]
MVEETRHQPTGRLATQPSVRAAALAQRLPLRAIVAWLALLLLILAIPMVFNTVWMNTINLILVAIVAVTGLNLLVGYTGQISLGHAAFAMIGGFTVALMFDHWPGLRTSPWQLYLTLPAAGLSATLVGTLFGVPSLRVKGLYLAIATLAAHPILTWIVEHLYPELTVEGVPFSSLPVARPVLAIPGWTHTVRTDIDRYHLFIILAVLGIVIARNIVRTRVGRAFIAIRDNDIAAESSGISLFKYKLLAFAVSSFYAGVAGAMLVYYFRTATVESFTIARSIEYLAMAIIGGLGSLAGPVFGAIFIIVVPILVRDRVVLPVADTIPRLHQYFDFVREVLFGVLIIAFIILEPEGLYKLWLRLKAAVLHWIATLTGNRTRPAGEGARESG